jgi:succinyl-CoA synthetase alpha subunit
MSILLTKKSKIIVQGITGMEGSFHTEKMLEYGTKIVGGVTPCKGGTKFLNVPVFNTVQEAVDKTHANSSCIFVPPQFAADAIYEACDAGIKLIICITEGIPVNDMLKAYSYVKQKGATLIGPNCPGIITPGVGKLGIMPAFIHKKGNVGVISRSGTLTYEAVHQLSELGIGQSTCIGIGGDPIIGTKFLDAIKLFNEDKDTKAIVMIGEIGGSAEEEAAYYIKKFVKKPVIAFIAGKTAPSGRRMGHAGAIISGGKGTAHEKISVMKKCGITVCEDPSTIGVTVKVALGKLNKKPKPKAKEKVTKLTKTKSKKK